MKEEIIREIKRQCNFRERILLKLFPKIFIKVYHISRIKTFNYIQRE